MWKVPNLSWGIFHWRRKWICLASVSVGKNWSLNMESSQLIYLSNFFYVFPVLNCKFPLAFIEYQGATYKDDTDQSLANCGQEKIAQMIKPSYRWLKNKCDDWGKYVCADCIYNDGEQEPLRAQDRTLWGCLS